MTELDIIIPAKNEAASLLQLVTRIDKALKDKISYRIIYVDDRSTDDTAKILKRLSKKFPITHLLKEGIPGKAFSILEGASLSTAPVLAMIDADLEYPPEAIPVMYDQMHTHGVVVAKRITTHTGFLRHLASNSHSILFGRLLLGLNCDIQSGLKLFRREVITHIDSSLVGAWSIDIPLLHTNRELGYTLGQVPIDFVTRQVGISKLKQEFLVAAKQIGIGAIKTRFAKHKVYEFPATGADSMVGAGFAYKKHRFITHSTLPHHHSAIYTLVPWQKYTLLGLFAVLFLGLFVNPLLTGIVFTALLSSIYFADVVFSLFLVLKSLHFPPELSFSSAELDNCKTDKLPTYSILCPLYKEAHVLPKFVENISKLDWPKAKLDVLLLLEEDDSKTIEAAKSMNLPEYFRVLVVPHSFPKTKPKACNYGLSHAKGEYVVIYDAEDEPEPSQLKKAYLGFLKSSEKTVCLQAKLNYYNPHQNLLTRFFTAEYSLWFDVVLPGLQSLSTTIPLGGTSNHFKTKVLKQLHGWDAFNVTEDCDLGSRLFKLGYTTGIVDSITLEEANSKIGNWIRQRSRWIKGYMQTFFVHNRHPLRFIKEHGIHALIFQLVIGMRMAFMIINPFLWLATIAYFTLYQFVGPAIEALYPSIIFYLAAISLVFGNFLYVYYYMIGCAKRGAWPVIKYVFLIPFYWLLVSIAAFKAFSQLIFKPHYWEKTTHGLNVSVKSAFSLKNYYKYVPGGLLIGASLFGNFFNFLYNAYLGRARNVSVEEFGMLSLVSSLLYISQIPASALSRTVTYRSAYLLGKHQVTVKRFWQSLRKRIFPVSILLTLVWLVLSPVLAQIFHSNSVLPFLIFSPVWILSLLTAVDGGFLYGYQKFGLMALSSVLEAVFKLLITMVFVHLNLPEYIYASIPLSMLVSFMVVWFVAKSMQDSAKSLDDQTTLYFPRRFFATSILVRLSSMAFLSLDVILAKIFLSPVQAGQYALIALVGKMVYFVGSLFSQFVTPIVSKAEGEGANSKNVFYKLLAAISFSSFVAFVLVGVLGYITVPLLFGPKALAIVSYLPAFCLSMAAFTIATTIVNYHQIRKQYHFPIVGFFINILQIIVLYVYHSSLKLVVLDMLVMGLVYLFVVLTLHIFQNQLKIVSSHVLDLLDLFKSFRHVKRPTSGNLRILIFNWYDVKHVWAGGAELYVHNMAKEWVKAGHEVTMFTGNDQRSSQHETIDGVSVVRRGGQFTVALWGMIYYLLKFRGHFDVIIDVPKGVPFFTPLYVFGVPIVCLIFQVHQEMFRTGLAFPFKQISMFLEGQALPFVYRNIEMVAVSPSAKKSFESIGLGKSRAINIVEPGVEIKKAKIAKTKFPSVIYLGRLRPYKFIDLLIMAVSNAKVTIPDIKLYIAGSGEDEHRLKTIAAQLEMGSNIEFLGKVSDEEKAELFTKSWIAVQPSMVEGWGITNIEANLCGTPVIAANVDGLKDSVLDGQTGLLVKPMDPEAIEAAILKLVKDTKLRNALAKNAVAWGQNFSWPTCSNKFMEVINTNLNHKYDYMINKHPVYQNQTNQ